MIAKQLLGLLCVVTVVFASEDAVVDLIDDDFSTRIGEVDTTLVMFYAPWCGHCKRLKPEYANAASKLRGHDPAIRFAKVDCTEGGKDTCNKFSVSGYPTLKIFKNGDFSAEYKGPREADGIVSYMKKQVGPSSKHLASAEELNKFLDTTDPSIVGFFESKSTLETVFLKYADKMREKYRFAHTYAKENLDKYKEKDGILLFRPRHLKNKFEEEYVKFEGKDVGELSEFVSKNSHGLCGHRTRDNMQDFKHPIIIAYYEVDYIKNPKGTNYRRNRILSVAKKFEGKINFAISSQHDFQHEINEYGIDLVATKPLVVGRDSKNRKYIMKEEFSPENLLQFATNLESGKLEPYIKSEEIPASNDEPVKVAVAKNFNEVVIENGKDTLIEFYAPWCGHCKKLAPVFDEVAKKLEDEDVALVKMDATANDVPPEFEVRGFPTLFWLPKDSKDKPQSYDSGREADDFFKFIAKQATNELKGWDRQGNPKKTEL